MTGRPVTLQGPSLASIPDPRFILQAQAGLAAYAQITTTIPLTLAAGMYATLTLQSDAYLLGDYQLQSRPPADMVKLMIHRDGWAVAYHPRNVSAGRLLDWLPYDWQGNPGFVPNMPELAIDELAAALGVGEVVPGYFDFRHPSANWAYLHWSLQTGYGSKTSTLAMPLLNTYWDRGFGEGTNGYTAQLWLNGAQVVQVNGGTPANQFAWGSLTSAQLRSAYTNSLEQKTTTFLTSASAGGVVVVFEGDEMPLTAGQAYSRTLVLSWPDFLGQQLDIQSIYLPITKK